MCNLYDGHIYLNVCVYMGAGACARMRCAARGQASCRQPALDQQGCNKLYMNSVLLYSRLEPTLYYMTLIKGCIAGGRGWLLVGGMCVGVRVLCACVICMMGIYT